MKITYLYKTKNPLFPEAHKNRYASKRVCDCTWGTQWTQKVKITETTCRHTPTAHR